MSLNLVTLTFESQDAADDATSGGVTIQPTGQVTAAGQTVVSPAPVIRQFSGGVTSVQLVANDSEGTTPAAGFWAYLITMPGGNPLPYLVNYANGATQRFDNLTPAVASTTYGPAASSGAVSSVFGRTGAVVAASGDYTAAQTGALAAKSGSTSVPAADLSPLVTVLTDASSVAVNAGLGNHFRLTFTSGIGASRTIAAPSNPADGEPLTLELIQAASGGPYTVTWASGAGGYDFGAAGAPVLSAGASAIDMVGFRYSASKGEWLCAGSALGF